MSSSSPRLTTETMRPVDWFAIGAYIAQAIVATGTHHPELLSHPEVPQACYNIARQLDIERLKRLAHNLKEQQ